jgi:hypothetical protein
MTIDELIRQVRYCIDEEAFNTSNLDVTTDSDNTMLNNLIKSKIGDAFKWCAMYAPSELLVTESHSNTSNDIIISIKPNPIITERGTELARFDLPATFLRLVRVKADDWKRAVSVAIEEDSEEYLCLSDDTAKATLDRPVAAIIRSSPLKMEIYPYTGGNKDIELTYVNDISGTDFTSVTDIPVPSRVRNAFIYYIAYLVMCAYDNASMAQIMLNIAKTNLGIDK